MNGLIVRAGVADAGIKCELSQYGIQNGRNISGEREMRALLQTSREPIQNPANAEEGAFSIYGRELTEVIIGSYTIKMWGFARAEMPISIPARLPIRYDDQSGYVYSAYQVMPADGSLTLLERMLDHSAIEEVQLSTTFNKSMESQFSHLFNLMPIDEYFERRSGPMPYRSIKFEHRFDEPFNYTVPTVNLTYTGKCARKTAWPLYPGSGGAVGTHITYEESRSYEDNNLQLYDPIKAIDGWPQRRCKHYEDLSKKRDVMTFIGRCGQYIYYALQKLVANSLSIAKNSLRHPAYK